MLLPPSVEDFIPSGHLARVISDVVETIDVKDIEARYSHLEQKSYFLRHCWCCSPTTQL
jgi:transposase